jgi:pseudomonalisin
MQESSCAKNCANLYAALGLGLRRASILALLIALTTAPGSIVAQSLKHSVSTTDSFQRQVLPNHHPQWANESNDLGIVDAALPIENGAIVLSRSGERERAFEKLLADQQNPASADYHRWLSPTEVGEKFGPSDEEIQALTAWLQSNGLHVNWIPPSRMFIGFGGTAADIGHALQTELHSYRVNGVRHVSVASDPMIPVALAPSIKAIRGLYTVYDKPLHSATPMQFDSPLMNAASGLHFLAPADFATIYDLPSGVTGSGQTIGIVGESRTDFADFANFRAKTETSFPNPTEIVPTAFGGLDPGPAFTSPPSGNTSVGTQLEATLDIVRAGSVAPGASLLLVVATESSGGIDADAQYLVQTSPLPAQVISISFGGCESAAGKSGVDFWDTLFQQAASEGISVFVSSGDSGASGCDAPFATPPASPQANSPNYICSSSYATCVSGTEFNDSSNPSQYWGTTNPANLGTATGYIPEGAWNEPLDSNSHPQVAASGGGVSSIIATPSWQTGTGVPAARSGRYTPDLAFSSSGHDGYFGCFAAGLGDCVNKTDGSYQFEIFFGTSAAAPSMAGIAALLNEQIGIAQGNLNTEIYDLAAITPAAFHDATVSTSGVSICSASTPSMCNNSNPGPSGLSGGDAGYLLTTGYDEVTGLGSLDVSVFLANYVGVKTKPNVVITPAPANITTAQSLSVSVAVNGSATTPPTGTVTLTSGSFVAGPVALSGFAVFNLAAGSLAVGNDVLTVTYTPDAEGARFYDSSSGSTSIAVTAVGPITPTLSVFSPTSSITTAESLQVETSVNAPVGDQAPTGTVILTSGTYSSPAAKLFGGLTFITIPAQTLAVGTDTVTATYTPDTLSSSIYKGSAGSEAVTVTAAVKTAPTVGVVLSSTNLTATQALSVTINVSPPGGVGAQTPTGSVALVSGAYASPATVLANGFATIIVPGGSLEPGSDILTATYTPDSGSSAIYESSSGSSTVTVTAPPQPSFTVSGQAVSLVPGATTGNMSTITVTPTGNFTGIVTLTAAITTTPAGAKYLPVVSFGSTNSVNISSTSSESVSLTVTTTASTSAEMQPHPVGLPWYVSGGATLGCLLLFGLPNRRQRWHSLVGMLMLLLSLGSGMVACGNRGSGGAIGNPGTAVGSYTITVTGTSRAILETGTINLTVQ